MIEQRTVSEGQLDYLRKQLAKHKVHGSYSAYLNDEQRFTNPVTYRIPVPTEENNEDHLAVLLEQDKEATYEVWGDSIVVPYIFSLLESEVPVKIRELENTPLHVLGLTTRTHQALTEDNGIITIGELRNYAVIEKGYERKATFAGFRGIGEKADTEIVMRLLEFGVEPIEFRYHFDEILVRILGEDELEAQQFPQQRLYAALNRLHRPKNQNMVRHPKAKRGEQAESLPAQQEVGGLAEDAKAILRSISDFFKW